MAQKKAIFVCQNCGFKSAKWLGKCPDCEEWNCFSEESTSAFLPKVSAKGIQVIEPVKLSEISENDIKRIKTSIKELDRVFGGGIVPDSLTLIGGAPGIGKSTITLQVASELAKERKVLYISAEESEGQIKMRASRLGISSNNIYLLTESNFEAIKVVIEKMRPQIVIVDSIQTMYTGNISSTPGSVSQLREVTFAFMDFSKRFHFATILIGHVTKDGAIAGPKVLEHMVDTVLYFEGEHNGNLRILRSMKNRFGATNEIGVFEMRGNGLIEITNPSLLFVNITKESLSGCALMAVMEGTRSLLTEIQALIFQTHYQMPKRTSVGFDLNRLHMLLAIMDKYLGLKFAQNDVYVNVVGGFKIDDTATDLGVMAALISNYLNKSIPYNIAFMGEVGLNGEIRGVPFLESRLKEMEKLGVKKVILPEQSASSISEGQFKLELIYVSQIREFFRFLNALN
ncbi:DNA repair protein RadA [bacterium]|nr:DNA repair protein RadA [bacterium]